MQRVSQRAYHPVQKLNRPGTGLEENKLKFRIDSCFQLRTVNVDKTGIAAAAEF